VLGWLLIPAKGEQSSIASRARHDSRGIGIALALASALFVFLLLAGVLNDGAIEQYGWPQIISVAGLALLWRNASDEERAGLRRVVAPLENLGGGESTRRGTQLRLAGAAVLLVTGLGWLLSLHGGTRLLAPLGGIFLVAAAFVLLLGPWWLRVARDLVLERYARARAEERADIAARVHDSVLQTLALIQRRADDPQAVVQLARAQERELRSWLFEGRAPGDTDASSFAEGVRQIQRDTEARHGVPVEVVTVADCPLDEHLNALLAAAREATVNAAKWSGAPVISVFAEVEPDTVSVTVRDRGKGFDPDVVPDDRKGVAESIRARMDRHGGAATVQSAPGEGTKVTLTMPRRPAGGDRDRKSDWSRRSAEDQRAEGHQR
jgi:signal transduction histidine kinase